MTYDSIRRSSQDARNSKEIFINGVLVFTQGKLPEGCNLREVKKMVESSVPKRLFKDLDYIFVGDFPELKLRDVESVYMRGAIYISGENQTNENIYAAIVHELGHSIETVFQERIYRGEELAAEFTAKRKTLQGLLKQNNLEFEDPTIYSRIEFNPQFDEFLNNEVGYDRLAQLTTGLFASPYAATSLREYFANGFEGYFLSDRQYLAKICPKLFRKLAELIGRS